MKIIMTPFSTQRLLAVVAFLFLLAHSGLALAQIDPMGAMYFRNQYLANPAVAGLNGIDINVGYRSQWSSVPGSPRVQNATGQYALNEKVGLGINFNNDKAGLFTKTRVAATYAYRLPLGDSDRKLAFGLSLGVLNDRLDYSNLEGDIDDNNLESYNDRRNYLDSDFGLAYLSNGFNFQATLPNMKRFFKRDDATGTINSSTFFSSVCYKILLSNGADGFELEPKLVYRGIQEIDDIVDAGANISYAENKINLFGMYHSSRNATIGLGVNFQNFGIEAIHTTASSEINNFTSGSFEINLGIRLGK